MDLRPDAADAADAAAPAHWCAALDEIRARLLRGDHGGAEEEAERLVGEAPPMGAYQPLACSRSRGPSEHDGYRRRLDLATGSSEVWIRRGDGEERRSVLVSHRHQWWSCGSCAHAGAVGGIGHDPLRTGRGPTGDRRRRRVP